VYVAHKERLFALGMARDEAAHRERAAYERLLNAREFLRMHIARSMARSSGFAEEADLVVK
jgi:hypothetical protein